MVRLLTFISAFVAIHYSVQAIKFNEGALSEYNNNSVDKYIKDRIVKRDEEAEIINLTSPKELEDLINTKKPCFVNYTNPSCAYCKSIQPIWVQVTRDLTNIVNVAQVNCTSTLEFCRNYGIKGVPTLLYFTRESAINYNGPRTTDALVKYAIENSK